MVIVQQFLVPLVNEKGWLLETGKGHSQWFHHVGVHVVALERSMIDVQQLYIHIRT